MFHPRLLKGKSSNTKKRTNYIYGWKKDCYDERDYPYYATAHVKSTLDKFILSQKIPVFDQSTISSCVANSLAGCLIYMYSLHSNIPSRMFMYYIARILDGNVDVDIGCTFRSAIKAIKYWGTCYENQWPYITSNVLVRPNSLCFSSIPRFHIKRYERLPCTPPSWEHCLYVLKKPFVFGVSIYSSFFTSVNGNIKTPHFQSETCIGGHAMIAIGYDKNKKIIHFQNSWGVGWGNKGCGTISYNYLTSTHANTDMWIIY